MDLTLVQSESWSRYKTDNSNCCCVFVANAGNTIIEIESNLTDALAEDSTPNVSTADSHLLSAAATDNNDDNLSTASLSTPILATTPLGQCGSVSYTLGTPLAFDCSDDGTDRETSITKLPDRSLFSVGVSDHILYENLPNATGTFQRLRTVIHSLRNAASSSRENSPSSKQN